MWGQPPFWIMGSQKLCLCLCLAPTLRPCPMFIHIFTTSHIFFMPSDVSGIPVYKTKLVLFPIYWTLLLSFNLSEIWAYFEYFRITYMYRSNNFTIYVMMMTWLARDMCVLSTIYFSYHGSFVPRINYIIRDAFVLIKAIY